MSALGKQVNTVLLSLKNGDMSAFGELFSLTYNHLIVVAHKYAFNKSDVEDILSNAYERALKYVNTFSSDKDGYNWLCKIVQNEAIKFNQNGAKTTELKEVAEDEKNEDNALLRIEVELCLTKYSERDRKMLYLRFWENLSYREIATILGLKKSYIHKRITQILDSVYKKMN